jgi:SAM-dependent methyltransferase
MERKDAPMPDYTVEFGKRGRQADSGDRLDAAAFHRNHEAIWAALEKFLRGKTGDVVEAGSGTGQHVVFFARRSPGITWWPSDLNDNHLRSIAAWIDYEQLANVRPPLRIDLSNPEWFPETNQGPGCGETLAVFCANVIHIAPWRVAEGLIAGAARYLRPEGRLFLYGPFKRGGQHTAPSNAAFDASLRNNDPEWGVRDVDEVTALAQRNGLKLLDIVGMPANNLILVFERHAG